MESLSSVLSIISISNTSCAGSENKVFFKPFKLSVLPFLPNPCLAKARSGERRHCRNPPTKDRACLPRRTADTAKMRGAPIAHESLATPHFYASVHFLRCSFLKNFFAVSYPYPYAEFCRPNIRRRIREARIYCKKERHSFAR